MTCVLLKADLPRDHDHPAARRSPGGPAATLGARLETGSPPVDNHTPHARTTAPPPASRAHALRKVYGTGAAEVRA